MRRLVVAVVALVLAACGGARGAARGGAEPRHLDAAPVRLQPPPIFGLLGARERLALTSEQVSQLDSIAVWLGNANRELHRDLQRLVRPRPRGSMGPDVISPDTLFAGTPRSGACWNWCQAAAPPAEADGPETGR